MADPLTLANILAGDVSDQNAFSPINEQYPAQSLEGAKQREWSNGLWGPKTSTDDLWHHLPASLVGEWLHRYQGVLAHGAFAAIPPAAGASLGVRLFELANFLGNGGYVAGTIGLGRTAPIKRAEDQLPQPTYPHKPPSFAE